MGVNWVEQVHTTELGEQRIKRNLGLDTDDVIAWCKRAILAADRDSIIRNGKNWYVYGKGFVLTVKSKQSHGNHRAQKGDPLSDDGEDKYTT
jgi:hypothetical protein